MESSSATVFRAALCAASLVGTYSARGAGSVLVVRASKPVAIVKRAVSAAVVIVILRRLEKALGTGLAPVPGALSGMILLSTALIAASKLGGRYGRKFAAKVDAFCEPASEVLSRWMPLFFVSPLVSLPLALKTISLRDAPIALFAHVLLYFLTCGSTAQVTRLLSRSNMKHAPTSSASTTTDASTNPQKLSTAAEGRSTNRTNVPLFVTGISTAVLSALSIFFPLQWLKDALLVTLTAFTYVVGSSIPNLKTVLHPVVFCGVTTGVATAILGGGSAALQQYANGPGMLYMALLGTSLFSLGFKMYKARDVIIDNALPIAVGSSWAAIFSLYGTAIVARLLRVNKTLAKAFLARSLTTPLAVAVAKMLNADVSLTVGAVVLSGILGANFGKQFLRLLRIRRSESTTRGVAMGASAHGLGTAALSVDEPEASSTAAVTFALTGALSTLIVSIHPLRKLLLQISAGTAKN